MNDETQKRQQALLRVALRSAVARASDEQLEQARPRLLAERLVKTRLDNAQIRNLENLAYTTDKVSDITDLLKKLIGRDTRRRGWANDNVGRDVIETLEALRAEADRIVKNIPDQFRGAVDPDLPRRVHLDLCREFVKHLTAEFMYRKREVKDG
jgi:hypothetical protein